VKVGVYGYKGLVNYRFGWMKVVYDWWFVFWMKFVIDLWKN
jgi:hypothetical protein